MRVAIAQFAVDREPDRNIETIRTYAMQASANGARVLLLPEGIIARDATDPYYPAHHAQPIDGPFVAALRAISAQTGVTLMGTVHVIDPTAPKPSNVFLVIGNGEIRLAYRKIHLYDAFGERESDVIETGNEVPAVRRDDLLRSAVPRTGTGACHCRRGRVGRLGSLGAWSGQGGPLDHAMQGTCVGEHMLLDGMQRTQRA